MLIPASTATSSRRRPFTRLRPPKKRHPGLLRGEPFAAAGEEVADLIAVVHAFDRTAAPGAEGGSGITGEDRPCLPGDELYFTTKLWIQHTGEDTAKREFDQSLRRLGLDHLDRYLIHQPFGDYYSSWRAMQKLYGQGLIKAIGVSNFYPDRLVDLIQHNDITPAVNQIETHPFFQRPEYQHLMREHGVQIESWGPFAEGRNNLFSNPTLTEFELTGDEMTRVAALDTGASVFFDHHDPAMVGWLGGRRVD